MTIWKKIKKFVRNKILHYYKIEDLIDTLQFGYIGDDSALNQSRLYTQALERFNNMLEGVMELDFGEEDSHWVVNSYYYTFGIDYTIINKDREKCSCCGNGLDKPMNFPKNFPNKYKLCCFCLDELNRMLDPSYKRQYMHPIKDEKTKEKIKLLCMKNF